MALYDVTLYKRIFDNDVDKPWTNVYHVDAATAEDALDHAESIVEIEKAVHWSIVEFFRVSARQALDDAPAGQSRDISTLGTRDADGETYLPLFCTIRVILDDIVNRPDQKYLRTPLMESEVQNGFIQSGTLTLMDTTYVGGLIALPYIRSSSNSSYVGGFTQAPIQMRQRDWKRRSRPGFKRGWVPV